MDDAKLIASVLILDWGGLRIDENSIDRLNSGKSKDKPWRDTRIARALTYGSGYAARIGNPGLKLAVQAAVGIVMGEKP